MMIFSRSISIYVAIADFENDSFAISADTGCAQIFFKSAPHMGQATRKVARMIMLTVINIPCQLTNYASQENLCSLVVTQIISIKKI